MGAKAIFGPYQTSGMPTSKWHAFNHLVESLQHDMSMEYLDTSCFESFHKIFKTNYKKRREQDTRPCRTLSAKANFESF